MIKISQPLNDKPRNLLTIKNLASQPLAILKTTKPLTAWIKAGKTGIDVSAIASK